MEKRSITKLVVSIIICQLAGGIGAIFTTASIPTWYATLAKPDLAPPNWIFGPVWTTLYLLMGISLYLIWSKGAKRPEVKFGISFFAIQLALNAIWSVLFFCENPGIAFAEIIVLWISIALTMWYFRKVDQRAAWLLLPYLAWVTFAAALNYGIWVLN